MKSIIVIHSYHHNNTRKIAKIISKELNSEIKNAVSTKKEDIKDFDLIGFGSGIDSGRHYQELLDFVEKLPNVSHKKCFIFSTSAVQGERKVKKDHKLLRDMLTNKGYSIIGEFSCKGFNTNLFLKYFGGMNKNRPNEEDFQNAREFAISIDKV